MCRVKFFVVAIFLHGFTLSSLAQSKIVNIQAKLFYNERKTGEKDFSGTFSKNIISDKDFHLWNVPIGEGSADGCSNQMIVIVEIASSNLPNKKQILLLSATSGSKILLKEKRQFTCLEDHANHKLLFLLNGIGCGTIVLKADIIKNTSVLSTMSKAMKFECGE